MDNIKLIIDVVICTFSLLHLLDSDNKNDRGSYGIALGICFSSIVHGY